jgi:6-methylsalicylate decarboxylase
MRIDVHQHLWTERLWATLARRGAAPCLRGEELLLDGEPPFVLAGGPQDPARRAASLADLGVDVAVLALSTALGVERLPGDEAREVLAAWDEDADALPASLPAWGSLPLADAEPADVDAAIERGRVGIVLPADALATPAALDRVGPLLERLAAHDAPLFVHPGPASAGTWQPAVTSYVAGLQQAWLAWVLHGRAQHPRLRVVFAALAGLAPLQAERLRARVPGAPPRPADDPLTFFETSACGELAVHAVAAAAGPEALVHGSDWPYAEPTGPFAPLQRAITRDNPAALLGHRRAAVAA